MKNFQHKSTLIKFDKFKILVTRKKVKYARLKVGSEANITLSLPLNFSQNSTMLFLEKNKTWLEEKVAKKKALMLPKDKTMLLGRIYSLKFDENLKEIQIYNDEIYAPNLTKFIKFKRNFAKNEFMKFIEIYALVINKKINNVVVRDMKTRWGSCNTKKGYINLALNLIEKSPDLIEYVVLHELTHLLYPHHQKDFYDYIFKLMPDYKEREKKLRNS